MQVLVAGHSFVRRFRKFLTKEQRSLDTELVSITLTDKGGAYCTGPKSITSQINNAYSQSNFPLLILELGSNDIDKGKRLHDVVDAYVHEVEILCRTHSAHAVLCLPIPRLESKYPGSAGKTARFNTLLKKRVSHLDQIATWKHDGLFKASGRTMDRDALHLNDEGYTKYFYSLKSAITMFSGRLRRGSFK